MRVRAGAAAATGFALGALAGALAEEYNGRDGLAIEWEGPTYYVTYSFNTSCPRDTLYAFFFDPAHVRRCIGRTNLEITTLDSAASRNRLLYAYSYLGTRLYMTFDRAVDTNGGRITFSLDSCHVSGSKLVPVVRSSRGHYALVAQGDSTRVEYRQETTLDRDLNRLYIHFIRRDTRRVLRNQERYANTYGRQR